MRIHDLEATINAFLARQTPPCLALVSPAMAQLTATLTLLQEAYRWPRIVLGRELSAALLATAPAAWPQTATRWIEQHVRQAAPGPVLLSEIDLVFEPRLQLDPLRLFCRVGRYAPLVILWPGNYADDTLTYATPEHAHYRVWRRPEIAIFQM